LKPSLWKDGMTLPIKENNGTWS